ncbi:reverse transcriptase [Operophtera brumata]|uniref:Reverse transcriptase n=1 Tax=Operophtera brumata TaxID=104452 RepID=A0A0L7L4K5_OPEBR|nr:reverse transcriptase [Operophtera brumata]
MIDSESAWDAVSMFAEMVMTAKEEAERWRELSENLMRAWRGESAGGTGRVTDASQRKTVESRECGLTVRGWMHEVRGLRALEMM